MGYCCEKFSEMWDCGCVKVMARKDQSKPEFVIWFHGNTSDPEGKNQIVIRYCPFCGTNLSKFYQLT